MKENVEIFSDFIPLTQEQLKKIDKVRETIMDMPTISCTACNYCTEGCPVNMKIPDIIKVVNSERLYPGDSRNKMFYNNLIDGQSVRASKCIECGQCESVCPQHLEIITYLKEAADTFDK